MKEFFRERFSLLFSSDWPLELRMFLLGSFIAFGTFLAGLIVSVVTGRGYPVLLILVLLILVLAGVIAYVLRTHNTVVGGTIFSLVIGLGIFPAGYILAGGAMSSAPLWFIIAIAFMATIIRTNHFWMFALIATIAFGTVSYVAYKFPCVVVPLPDEGSIYFDMFFVVTAVAFLVSILLRYTARIYNSESELAKKQKEEIQELSDAQNRFFGSMSHEIRTPINTIIGLSEMTLRDQQISGEVADNAVNIQNASRMLLSVINDILDISSIQSGRMELVEKQYETSRMLSDVVNMLWIRAKEKNLHFEVNVGEHVPSMLFGDEVRLRQVIANIVANAIKYTDEGTVALSVDGEMHGPNNFLLRISVDDTGMGIRKELIPYLFDSFRRVNIDRSRNAEGSGLGLALAKQLVDLMEGTITVDSIFTKGSHFQVELLQKVVDSSPMQYTAFGDTAIVSAYEKVFEAPEAHVLIVDDNDMNRMVSRKLLRATRAQIDVAASGAECLEKTALTHYDVIFMDHEMPGMDGLETLRQVRQQQNGLCKNTPVVALTANAGSDLDAFYAKHGFQAYLAKPIHGSLFENALLQFLPPELIEHANMTAEAETVHFASLQRKRAIALTVDCPCDLPDSLLVENDIVRMPFYIITDEGRFRDVEEIDAENLFAYLERGSRAKADHASVEEYEVFFGNMLAEAEVVIHLAAYSKVSKAYDTACQAAASFSNVHVVDTKQYASGLGMMALYATDLLSAGANEKEIISSLDDYSKHIEMSTLVPEVDSPCVRFAAPPVLRGIFRIFSWEPVVGLGRGGLYLKGVHGGYVSSASDKYIKSVMRLAKHAAQKDKVFISCSGCTLAEQEAIYAAVEAAGIFKEIILHKTSASVAAATWMHSFGITYLREKKVKTI